MEIQIIPNKKPNIFDIPLDIFLFSFSDKNLVLLGSTNKSFLPLLEKGNKNKKKNIYHDKKIILKNFIMPKSDRDEFQWRLPSLDILPNREMYIRIVVNYYHMVSFVELIGLDPNKPSYQFGTLIHERVIPPNENKLRNIIQKLISIEVSNWTINKIKKNELSSSLNEIIKN